MMNRRLTLAACILTLGMQVVAQTQYDAALLSGSELNGTARFVGMGGAMSALGADISTIGTNPAGIGLYRSNEIALSFGFNATKAESNFGGSRMDDSRTRASFDQAGFVMSSKFGNETSVRYVNFAFNYHKSRNFNRQLLATGSLGVFTQTEPTASNTSDAVSSISEVDDIYDYTSGSGNPYSVTGSNYPYLGVMGVRTELVAVSSDESGLIGWNGQSSSYSSREEGGIQQYDFCMAFNVNDRVYLGVTVGVYDVDYKLTSLYTEDIYDGDHTGFYEHCNWRRTEGTGVDVKLGMIVRPIEDSPFRFGLSVHTPTWYELTDTYCSDMYSKIEYSDEDGTFTAEEYTPDYVGGANVQDYKLRTPWKLNFSAGTVLGGRVAIGAEYEFADCTSSRLYYDDGDEMYTQNQYLREDLKGTHTVRIGLEAKLTPEFNFRAGYNYSSSGYKQTAYKALNWNDIRTDTQYENNRDRHTVTVGLGYRQNGVFVDWAYKYDIYQSDFYAFSDDDLSATRVDNSRHQLLMTVGYRF